MKPLRRLRITIELWRMTGYDGKPCTFADAWEIAGAIA